MVLQEERISKSQTKRIQYYKFIRTCVLFAILLSYNCIHFKSSKAKRKKKRRVLVYIFVRENSDIYRQTGLIVGRLELNA